MSDIGDLRRNMKALNRKILEQLIAGSAEPVLVAQVDSPDWPVVLCNPAFEKATGEMDVFKKPFAEVVESILGRDIALEVSEVVRAGRETVIPVELDKQECLLTLLPLRAADGASTGYFAAYWRRAAGSVLSTGGEIQAALLKAKKRIRDMSREDPITGLLNAGAFKEVLLHDWSVAAREKTCLALLSFKLEDFDEYLTVFGRHAADSCQRRVAQAIRRCLRRASDIAARICGEHGDKIIVLSHTSGEGGVIEFAGKIASSVRELGLHHPKSSVSRFVTVSYQTMVKEAGNNEVNAGEFLDDLLRLE